MSIIAVLAGYVTWTVVFLGGSAAIRSVMASTHDEAGYSSDTSTLVVYLVLSIIASAMAGYVGAKISKVNIKRDTLILAGALLATGIPVRLASWNLLPIWYNMAFLLLLVPVTWWGSTFTVTRS